MAVQIRSEEHLRDPIADTDPVSAKESCGPADELAFFPEGTPAPRTPGRRVGMRATSRGTVGHDAPPYCTQVPVAVSQVVPTGQHTLHAGPVQAMVFGGQVAVVASPQAVGTRKFVELHRQMEFPPSVQQVNPTEQVSREPHPQTPSVHVSLTRQRVPQVPQLVGSVRVSTQAPPHAVVPVGQPGEGGGGGGAGGAGTGATRWGGAARQLPL
jgi:hypothetical protein